jgi:DNA-binding transcriptional LysR family regulator
LLGRKLCRVAYAPFAADGYLERHAARLPLPKHVWLSPDDSMAGSAVGRYMRRHLGAATVSARANSLASLAHAARAGLGAVILPCYLGESMGLRRLRPPLEEITTDLWLLTHPDLRKTARIRALSDFLEQELARERDLIEGRRAASARR